MGRFFEDPQFVEPKRFFKGIKPSKRRGPLRVWLLQRRDRPVFSYVREIRGCAPSSPWTADKFVS